MMRAIAATGGGPAPSSSAATSAGCSGQPSRDVQKHEDVDVNHAILEQMHCEHADFVVSRRLLTISPRRTLIEAINAARFDRAQ